jgi:ribonuclease HI
MPWVEATLRDQRVLARCDEQGRLVADGGRVDVVYKAGASKVYGACSGNPGPAGAGVVLLGPNKEIVEGYEYLGSQTNNVGELVGIERALDLVPHDVAEVTIYTDSQYAIGVLSKGWKAKANVALIGRIREKITARKKVHLVYVRGHAGIEHNEKADELARLAVSSRKTAMPSRTS